MLNSAPGGRRFAISVAVRGVVPVERFQVSDRLQLSADGSAVANIAYFMGADAFEPGEITIWQELCRQRRNIVEIGGNVGFFTVFGAASTQGKYRVVEPHPFNARSLRANLEINSINAEVLEAAVVGRNGPTSIKLNVPSRETGGHSTGAYIDGAEGIDRPGIETFMVGTLEGSELANGIDLLKLDVEGAEFEILEAMGDGLAKSRPIVLVEVRRPNRTPRLRRWLKHFCTENQFTIWALNSKPTKIPIDSILSVVLQDTYDTRDVILIPDEQVVEAKRIFELV